MGRPKPQQTMIRKAQETGTFKRVEIARTRCARCQQDGLLALPSGEPRPHLRPAVQGDPGWSEIVPVRVSCEE